MNVEDSIYITIDDVVLYIEIEAYRNTSGDDGEWPYEAAERDYQADAAMFAGALEQLREELVRLDTEEWEDEDDAEE